ncbi:MAG: transketolase [Candidatus Latescibacteria bacterium]|nr:transketolase [Candidatus Latescibacterota bacterium]
MTYNELERKAKEARKWLVETLVKCGAGHPGGALSSIDIMIALYFEVMNIDPNRPEWDERDRFILSKGHSSIGLYTTLYLKGMIEKDTLLTFRQNGSMLSGHPDMRKVRGVEMSTGSLGHGLSVGAGMALAGKMDKKKYRVFVIVGDGESQEGSIWEAIMFAAHYKLDNLTVILDRNGIQIDGITENIMSLEPYADKWKAFGWEVREINGHAMAEIVPALKSVPFTEGKPSVVIAHTIKGKGVSFMENTNAWHGGAPKGDLAAQALREVEEALAKD